MKDIFGFVNSALHYFFSHIIFNHAFDVQLTKLVSHIIDSYYTTIFCSGKGPGIVLWSYIKIGIWGLFMHSGQQS